MLCLPGKTIVYCADDSSRKALEDVGAEVVKTPGDDNSVDLASVLNDLGRRDINNLLVEAGRRSDLRIHFGWTGQRGER